MTKLGQKELAFIETLRQDMRSMHIERTSYLAMIAYLFISPGFLATFLYRLSASAYNKWGRGPAKLLWRINIMINSCYIHHKAKIGPGLQLQHPVGIVIGEGVAIGKNVTIYQNVTIGMSHSTGCQDDGLYPVIGDNVEIFSGAVVVGGVWIGKGARIGANAVVNKDVPPGSTVVGVPMRVIKASEKIENTERLTGT